MWKQELNRKIEGYRDRQKQNQEQDQPAAVAPAVTSRHAGQRLPATAGKMPQAAAAAAAGASRQTLATAPRQPAEGGPRATVSSSWRKVTPPSPAQKLEPLPKPSNGWASAAKPSQPLPSARIEPQPVPNQRPGREVSSAAVIAPIAVRAVAGVLDFGVIVVALGVFLGVFYLIGGVALTDIEGLRSIAIAFLGIVCFYWIFYVGYLGGTSGMNWLGLRVLNFDGEPPSGPQRRTRALGTILSTLSLGLGFAWSIADEERLTWHDRMSKTFVTRDGAAGFRVRTNAAGEAGRRLPEIRNATRA
jgi:uncharacterized RDD family membrane protein YckC